VPVAEFGFPHLPLFYSKKLLESSRVVVVDGSPPLPPVILESMEVLKLTESQICGITYRSTFFVALNGRSTSLSTSKSWCTSSVGRMARGAFFRLRPRTFKARLCRQRP
jgi:hypothetical protein